MICGRPRFQRACILLRFLLPIGAAKRGFREGCTLVVDRLCRLSRDLGLHHRRVICGLAPLFFSLSQLTTPRSVKSTVFGATVGWHRAKGGLRFKTHGVPVHPGIGYSRGMFSCLRMATASFNVTTHGHVLLKFLQTILVIHVCVVRLPHGGDVSSLLYATPPPVEVGRRPPGGGGGGLLGGGGLAAEQGLPRGLASRC